MNYAVKDSDQYGAVVDVYASAQRASARAKAIAGCLRDRDARPCVRPGAVAAWRHKNDIEAAGVVYVEPTDCPITDL